MKRVLQIIVIFIVFIIAGYLLSFPCQVKLDIKPKSCPNPLNVKSKGVKGVKGVLPVAILGGTAYGFFLNVDSINVSTIRLEGVAPIRWKIKDVATLVEDGECNCTTKKGRDGFPDLVLKFDKQEIVEAIGPVCDGDTVMLSLSEGSRLLDGTWIHGGDCVIIKAKAKKPKAFDANALGKAVSSGVPDKFYLDQNYPNPFNPETKISYCLPEGFQVRLIIYNLIGQEVQTIVNNFQPAGYYQVIWNGRDNQGRLASSGIYIYRLTAGTFTQTKRMVLLR